MFENQKEMTLEEIKEVMTAKEFEDYRKYCFDRFCEKIGAKTVTVTNANIRKTN